MRRFAIAIAFLTLAACTAGSATSRDPRVKNPLYAEYYFDDVVEQMVQLSLNKDPVLEDTKKKEAVDTVRREALALSKEANKKQNAGKSGHFAPVKGNTGGEALLTEDALYFGPEFQTTPGVDVRVYLSEMIDPRDGEFPDATAVDIGSLQSPYGDQTYALASPRTAARTVVLWDESLERIIGFAQLTGR